MDLDPTWRKSWDYVILLNRCVTEYGYESGYTHLDWYKECTAGISRQDGLAFKEAKSAGRIPWSPTPLPIIRTAQLGTSELSELQENMSKKYKLYHFHRTIRLG